MEIGSKVKHQSIRDGQTKHYPEVLRVMKLGTTFAFYVNVEEHTNADAGEWLPICRLTIQ